MAWAGRRSTGIVTPGSSIPTVVALTARSAFMAARPERRVVERHGGPPPVADRREPLQHHGRRAGGPVADGDPGGTGLEAGVHHGVRRAARAGHDDLRAGDRTAHRQLDPDLEAGRVGVEPDETTLGRPGDVVDRPDRLRVGLHLVAQPGHDQLVRRGHAEPEPVGTARRLDGRFDLVGLQLQQDVARVDAGRVERGVVHDLRVAPPERLAEQRDAPGHASVTRPPRRRAAPATASAGGEPAPRWTGT